MQKNTNAALEKLAGLSYCVFMWRLIGKPGLLLFCLISMLPLWAEDEHIRLVGLTLEELIDQFGIPRSVHAARGLEEWQDDVVFVYDEGDFYIYRNRVWQVGLKATGGIKTGDSAALVTLVLGDGLKGPDSSSLFYPINTQSWPMRMRIDFDIQGRLEMIFIYRTDL
jgi:hypothetical protein